jgi:hypothetical protein
MFDESLTGIGQPFSGAILLSEQAGDGEVPQGLKPSVFPRLVDGLKAVPFKAPFVS